MKWLILAILFAAANNALAWNENMFPPGYNNFWNNNPYAPSGNAFLRNYYMMEAERVQQENAARIRELEWKLEELNSRRRALDYNQKR